MVGILLRETLFVAEELRETLKMEVAQTGRLSIKEGSNNRKRWRLDDTEAKARARPIL
jgi:hypothetical protein